MANKTIVHSSDEENDHGDEHGDEHGEHGDEHPEGEGKFNVTTFKIILMIIMFLEVYIGLIPSCCGDRCKANPTPLSFLNCFSAGIFLAMALLHVAPGAMETWESWAKCNDLKEPYFPLPSMVIMFGYCLILAIDKWLAKAYHMDHEEGNEERANREDELAD